MAARHDMRKRYQRVVAPHPVRTSFLQKRFFAEICQFLQPCHLLPQPFSDISVPLMHNLSALLVLTFALASMSSLVGCAGSSGLPTDPSASSATLAPSGPNTFLGSVSLPGGGTGTLMVRAAATLDVMPPGSYGLLGMLFDFLLPSLNAQSGAASGVLTLSDGDSVTLAGTHNAGAFQLSASGGYSANVSVANGALSGMVSTPAGPAVVAPLGFPAAAPPTSATAGLYSGSYELNVDGFYLHTIAATGVLVRSCSMRVKVTGSVTARVYVPTDRPNTWAAHVLDTWREVQNIDPNCSTTSGPYERVITPLGALGFEVHRRSLHYAERPRGQVHQQHRQRSPDAHILGSRRRRGARSPHVEIVPVHGASRSARDLDAYGRLSDHRGDIHASEVAVQAAYLRSLRPFPRPSIGGRALVGKNMVLTMYGTRPAAGLLFISARSVRWKSMTSCDRSVGRSHMVN